MSAVVRNGLASSSFCFFRHLRPRPADCDLFGLVPHACRFAITAFLAAILTAESPDNSHGTLNAIFCKLLSLDCPACALLTLMSCCRGIKVAPHRLVTRACEYGFIPSLVARKAGDYDCGSHVMGWM